MRYIVKNVVYFLTVSSLMLLFGCGDSPNFIIVHDERGVFSAKLSNDAEMLLIASVEKSAQLWNFQKAERKHNWTLEKGGQTDFAHVALSGDGTVAVTADASTVAVWNTDTGKSIGFWKMSGYIIGIQLSEIGGYALIAYGDRSIELVDLQFGQTIWKAEHAAYIESIALSPDAHYALVGCDDNTATLWDIKNNKRAYLWEEKTRIRHVALSPNNKFALTSAPFQTIKIWNIETGELQYELRESPSLLKFLSRPIIHVSSAVFSKDDSYLITGAPPRNVYLWNLNTGSLVSKWVIPKHTVWKPTSAIVYATAFSADEKTVYAEASNGYGYTWRRKDK